MSAASSGESSAGSALEARAVGPQAAGRCRTRGQSQRSRYPEAADEAALPLRLEARPEPPLTGAHAGLEVGMSSVMKNAWKQPKRLGDHCDRVAEDVGPRPTERLDERCAVHTEAGGEGAEHRVARRGRRAARTSKIVQPRGGGPPKAGTRASPPKAGASAAAPTSDPGATRGICWAARRLPGAQGGAAGRASQPGAWSTRAFFAHPSGSLRAPSGREGHPCGETVSPLYARRTLWTR